MAFWRSGVLIMRPRRPPRSPRRFFATPAAPPPRPGPSLVTGQIPLEDLDALLFLPGRLAQPLGAGALPVVGLLAGGPPSLDLLGVEASLAAVGGEIGLVQGGGLEDGRELVARRPTIRAGVGIGQEPPLAAGIAAPDVQRRLGNPLLLGQLPQGYRVRRLQLLQNRRTALRRVGQLIPPSRPSENRAVQRCAASLAGPGCDRSGQNDSGGREIGFPDRRNSDSWGGNRGGGCRDRVCAAAGTAGGGA